MIDVAAEAPAPRARLLRADRPTGPDRDLQPDRDRGAARRRGARADRGPPGRRARPRGRLCRLGPAGARPARPRRRGRAARPRMRRHLNPCRRAGRGASAGPARSSCSSAIRTSGCRCSSTPAPGRHQARGGFADRASVVARPDRLRVPDAGGLADVRGLGAPAPSDPARPVRDARRRRAAAQRAPGRARRAADRPPGSADLLRHLELRPAAIEAMASRRGPRPARSTAPIARWSNRPGPSGTRL